MRGLVFRLVASSTALVLAASCSLTMQTLSTPHNPSVEPVCDSSPVRPTLDVVGGLGIGLVGSFLTIAGSLLGCGDSILDDEECEVNSAGLAASLLIGAAVVGTGIYGGVRAGQCAAAKRDHRAWLADGSPPVGPWREKRAVVLTATEIAACEKWRTNLAEATTDDQKLEVARVRPAYCIHYNPKDSNAPGSDP